MRQTDLNDQYTVRELLLEMEILTRVRYSGKYGQILTDITKPQRLIIALGRQSTNIVIL